MAACSASFSASSTAVVIKPRGPTSRKTLYPASCIARTVMPNRTGFDHCSAISARAFFMREECGAAVAHDQTSHLGSLFIHVSVNFRIAGTSLEHFSVLKGRFSASLTALTPASAKAAIAVSANALSTAKVFWRGERSTARTALPGGKDSSTASASCSSRRRRETIAVSGRPE